MKRIIPFAAALLVAMSSQAQTVNVHMADKSTVKYAADKVEYVDFSSALTAPQTVEAVDLSLPSGTKWASMNIGATAPEKAGSYFAWGETQTSTDYGWDNYKWCGFNNENLIDVLGRNSVSKYTSTLNPGDDAASVNWGGKWRMPTKEEFQELIDNSIIEQTTIGDSVVAKFTSKKNGNYIYLPIAGWFNGHDMTWEREYGYYWSSTLNSEYTHTNKRGDKNYSQAWHFVIDCVGGPVTVIGYSHSRPVGECVRAVLADDNAVSYAPNGAEEVDLGLSVKWANMNVGATAPEEWGNYYAWGETGTKSAYGWWSEVLVGYDEDGKGVYEHTGSGYTFGAYDLCKMTGYNNPPTLESEDDAATANWGNEWRTPTKEDFEELIANTSIRKETINGVKGVKFTAANGNYIFIPYSGSAQGHKVVDKDANGGCWTSNIDPTNSNKGISYRFTHEVEASAKKLNSDYRPLGLPVRPVKK